MILQPLLMAPISVILVRYGGASHPPDWLGKAHIAALIIVAYMMIAPFALAGLLPRSSQQLHARGIDPDALITLAGIGSSVLPLLGAVLLVAMGDKVAYLCIGWVLTVVALGYWSWRKRGLLFPSRPPVVRAKDPQ
jgi:hypothetical protein